MTTPTTVAPACCNHKCCKGRDCPLRTRMAVSNAELKSIDTLKYIRRALLAYAVLALIAFAASY